MLRSSHSFDTHTHRERERARATSTSTGLIAIFCVVVAGCYAPTPATGVKCGPDQACPYGLVCSGATGTCEQTAIDAAITPESLFDARDCFGTGIVQVCPMEQPTTPFEPMGNAIIDTASSPLCDPLVTGTGLAQNPCVIVATEIKIDATFVYAAYGGRPLILLATDTIDVAGTITATADRALLGNTPGAGGDSSACGSGAAAAGEGGGAGGSFGGRGGGGGNGSGGSGATSALATASVTDLRGGCAGSIGAGGSAGFAGKGGGAIYLIAGTSIVISGKIDASGEGGDNGSLTGPTGGCGGGAGGMIGLDAPMVIVSGQAFANGGGGGGGGGTTSGGNGGDPLNPTTAATGGAAGTGGGIGGVGSVGLQLAGGAGAASAADSGGAGGGGAGVTKVYGVMVIAPNSISPPPS